MITNLPPLVTNDITLSTNAIGVFTTNMPPQTSGFEVGFDISSAGGILLAGILVAILLMGIYLVFKRRKRE